MNKKLLLIALAGTMSLSPFAMAQDMTPPVNKGGLPGYEVIAAPDVENLPRVKQKLVSPPFAPEHSLERPDGPRIVEIEMYIDEREIEVEPGVFMWAFTFHGSVPGPLIVVHEGDYVELKLINLSKNELVHNIDFHAATGALGGGDLTYVAPGQEVTLRFQATKPGVHIYHCAPGGAMIPWHVVHGMNGAIMVIPKEGLQDEEGNQLTYDKAYYIGEQDFYIPKDDNGEYIRFETAGESYPLDRLAMNTLVPSHITFGDRKGAYTGDNALTSKVGETVLLIHSQANRYSYPHLIGGHGEYVWERGNLQDKPATGLETWSIAAGSAGAAMYTFKQPGVYVYLNHNLIEAINLGAMAEIKVDGVWDNKYMEQITGAHVFEEGTHKKWDDIAAQK
ncbi:Copper-containing nitrite reductase precursor [Oligella ureolytica]|uniref:copper-containing nitrite reductase n=1 Tax=Oligella ureolytica TaxID=90244 RepID=UPI000E00D408|nr:copper-containing nitrite reductase [Oligella ureolytica]SUA53234.1 Copper-containing nitrite reductase precursor [Oligella ureolytica]